MKIRLKLSLCLLALAAAITPSCKSKSPDPKKGLAIIDSLKITDPQEKKVSTEYISLMEEVLEAGKNHPLIVTDEYKAQFLSKYGKRIAAANNKMVDLFNKVNERERGKLKILMTTEINKFNSIK